MTTLDGLRTVCRKFVATYNKVEELVNWNRRSPTPQFRLQRLQREIEKEYKKTLVNCDYHLSKIINALETMEEKEK